MSQEFKAAGNKAFSEGNFAEAIQHFTKAIEATPSDAILYSNRSAAYTSLKNFDAALEDAEKSISLKPQWSKAYSRKGAALYGKSQFAEAIEAYEKGLEIDPENQAISQALEDAKIRLKPQQAFKSPFSGSEAISKLMSHPSTAQLMKKPEFLQKLQSINQNPKNLGAYLQDPDIMTAFGAILGISEGGFNASENGDGSSEKLHSNSSDPCCSPGGKCSRESATESRTQPPAAKKSPQPEPELPDNKKESLAQKEQGNTFYKKRQFDEALLCYEKALELDTENVAVLANISAVFFEQGRFDECIEKSLEAVEAGRTHRLGFKFVAKLFGRVGNSFLKKQDLENAVKYFQKSLVEDRNPEIALLLKKTEKELEKAKKEAYKNPEISDAERNKGNELFKQGQFVEAMACYNEAIKRNDQDARNYGNRAACYIKLTAFPEAYKDCETALVLDPKFIKAHIRKANILFLRKDYAKCIEACQEGLQVDPHNHDLNSQLSTAYAERNKSSATADPTKAASDPEIQAILSDPVMRTILEQMQNNPQALVEHMKNPSIAQKIRKLIAAGIIKTR